MGVLFKNVLKGLSKRKTQVLGIIFLMALSTILYVSINAATIRVEDTYYDYTKSQNIEDYSLLFNGIDLGSEAFTTDDERYDVCEMFSVECGNLEEIDPNEEKAYDEINIKIMQAAEFNRDVGLDVIEKYYVPFYEKKYDAKIDSEAYKEQNIKNVYHYFTVANEVVSKPYVESGKLPQNKGEIALSPKYAEVNNIKIGDEYEIEISKFSIFGEEEKEIYKYKVVGTAYLSNKMMGVNANTLLPDLEKETAVIMLDEDFKQIDLTLLGARNYSVKQNSNFDLKEIVENGTKDRGVIAHAYESFETFAVKSEIQNNKLFSTVFSVFIVGITIVIIGFIMRKRIENEAKQIGVLKSLGYKNREISIGYLAFPIVASLIGIIIGMIIGQIASLYFVGQYENSYTLPMSSSWINFELILYSFIIPFSIIILVSFFVVLYLLNVKVMDLLKPSNKHNVALDFPEIKFKTLISGIGQLITWPFRVAIYIIKLLVSFLQKILTSMLKPFKFKTRFKYSLAIRSLGRIFVIVFVVFLASMLMTFSLFASGMMKNLMDDTFSAYKFDYVSYYSIERFDERNSEDIDKVYEKYANVSQINGENPSNHLKENNVIIVPNDYFDSASVQVSGIDNEMKTKDLLDKDGNDIISRIFNSNGDDGILISSAMAARYSLSVGDKLKLDINNLETVQEIKGIFVDSFSLNSVYISRAKLIEIQTPNIEFLEEMIAEAVGISVEEFREKNDRSELYNAIYGLGDMPNDGAIVNFSLVDLQEQVDSAMNLMKVTIYVMVGISAIISLIVIVVMTGFTVEDNFKNISLLKVMGYKNREITNMTLLVYAPFIFIAFIISIPITYLALKIIVSILTASLGFEFPLRLNWYDPILGFSAIAFAYVVSLYFGRKSLNKITLQEALKEE